ncbi:hypothetical protein [Tellurirhabdus rosea]|uniref:hypothetical protein n=1 Tax=Tellurirhabdus rosea TaxID=2674997 RepID=UPI00224FDAA8|nr:hypothetical protein [Tellurirhabdus rosea]
MNNLVTVVDSRPKAAERPERIILFTYYLPGAFLLAFCLAYLYEAYTFAVDFPFMDDTSLLRLIYEIRKADAPAQVLHSFFVSDNDHRIVIPRLVAFVDYLLNGRLHFKAYIVLANGNVLLILLLLYKRFKALSLPLFYFLPVPLLLLQFQYHEVNNWALTGLQHTSLCLFALLISGILYSTESTAGFVLALLLAVASTFTHGNGITTFGIGLYLLASRRKFQWFGYWLLALLLCLLGYLWGYSFSGEASSPRRALSVFSLFFGLIGANFTIVSDSSSVASIAWGLLLFLGVTPFILLNFYRSLAGEKKPLSATSVIFADFTFLFLTVSMIAFFRAQETVIVPNRFKLYAAVCSALAYLLILRITARSYRNYVYAGLLCLCVFFNGLCFLHYTRAILLKRSQYVADTYNWKHHFHMVSIPFQFNANAQYYLRPAYQEGYWHLPDYLPGADQSLKRAKLLPVRPKTYTIREGEHVYRIIEAPITEFRHRALTNEVLFALIHQSTGKTYLTGGLPQRAAYRRMLTEGSVYSGIYSAKFATSTLPPGRYRVGLLYAETARSRPEAVLFDGFISW